MEMSRLIAGCCSRWIHLGGFPVMFSMCCMLTFIITYMISVVNGHVYPYFPTISDTGAVKPESNIFGFLLSICSFVGFVVILIRYVQYRHISENNEDHNHSKLLRMNKLAFLVGLITCIGSNLVAAFQDRGNSKTVHFIGALCVFGGGIIYSALQTYLSYAMLKCGINSKRLCRLRLLFTLLGGGCFIASSVLFELSMTKWNNTAHKVHVYSQWQPSDPGYAMHVGSTACEWLCAVFILLFFVTFYGEFKKIKLGMSVRRNDLNVLPFQISTDDEQESSLVYA